MHLRTATILIWLIGCAPAYAQQDAERVTVTGFVTDAETGEALTGANVYDVGRRTGTVTNAYGFYSLTIPAGPIVLRVSYVGYQPRLDTLRLTRDRRMDVALPPVSHGLGIVEVVGEREEGAVESTSMSTVRLPIDEVERLPAFLGEVDVIKAVQLLPGVQSGTEGSTALYVRGGGPDQNLILLDGAPVYNASHVFGFLSIFNAGVVHDADLVTGGFPARYGGRLSSVVDLHTKEGSRRDLGVEGSVGVVLSSLTAEGPLVEDKASFRVSARRTYIDVLARPLINRQLDEGQDLTSYFYDANARLDYRVSDRSRLSLSLYGGQDVYGFAHATEDRTSLPVYRERNAASSDWGNLTGTLRWNMLLSNRLFGSAALIFTRYRFDLFQQLTRSEETDPPTELAETVEYRSGVTDWTASLDLEYRPSPRHYLRFGGNLTQHEFEPGVSSLSIRASGEADVDSTLTPRAFPFAGVETYLYVEDDVRLGRRWKANVGLHGSAMFVEGTRYASLQPRVAVRFLVRPDWSLKASFGTMQQYLHLLTNTGLNLPTDLWVAATDRIGPQKAWQAAVGTARSIADGAYAIRVEGYVKRMRGLVEYEPGAGFAAPAENWEDRVETGAGWAYGAEILLRRQVGRTTGWLGYTLSRSRRQFDALNDGEPFPYRYDRRHDVALAVSHRWSERFDVGLTWVFGTGQAITVAEGRFFDARLLDPGAIASPARWSQLRSYGERGGFRMPSYHRLDVVLSWHFDDVLLLDGEASTLSVGAYNAYNRLNPFYIFETRRSDGSRVFKQASLFPILPFVSYRFEF